MPKPYVQEFIMSNGMKHTSVVLDKEEFNAFADELVALIDIRSGERATEESINRIKEACHLPMMERGAKTDKFFKRWGVTTNTLSVIVRGAGEKVMRNSFGRPASE